MDDFRRFHMVRLRIESHVSICIALANALAIMDSLARMAAVVTILVRVAAMVDLAGLI